MTIYGSNFTYDGLSSTDFNVIMCDIETVNTESNDEESQIISSTTAYKRTWDLHAVQKSAPLQFKITIVQPDGVFMDVSKERQLKKWLCKNKYCWLIIEQDTLENIMYFCVLTNPRKVNVGRMSAGIQFDVTCDANCAWSDLKSETYTTSGGSLTFNIDYESDYDDDEISPVLEITSLSNGIINIKNNTTNKTTTIANCITDEIIKIDGNNDAITTSASRNIIDDFNLEFLTLRENVNSITLTGNFSVVIKYRTPIRIGG